MPFINIKINAHESEELREKVANIILNNTSNILNKKRDLTSILVEFLPENSWFIGNKKVLTFYFEIKITKGTNTKEQKSKYIKAMYEDLKKLLGDISPASYVTIDEVEADAWGFEGLTQEFRYIESKLL